MVQQACYHMSVRLVGSMRMNDLEIHADLEFLVEALLSLSLLFRRLCKIRDLCLSGSN